MDDHLRAILSLLTRRWWVPIAMAAIIALIVIVMLQAAK